jgi:hypothetical protein
MNQAGNTLFQWLAIFRLTASQMLFFLLSMGDFCTRTRDLGALPTLLKGLQRTAESEKLEAISQSEQEHCHSYAAMALELLVQVGHPMTNHLATDPAFCVRFFQAFAERDDLEAQDLLHRTIELAQATYAPVFQVRADGSRGLGYAIGVTLAVECVADQVIIPGEIKAFGPTGPYGLSLDHPSMGYIKEHASEIEGAAAPGAEGWYHAYMLEMRDGLPPDEKAEAELGEREADQAINEWFRRLRMQLQHL